MKRKALGKGLSSLIPQAPAKTPTPVLDPVPPAAATDAARVGEAVLQIDVDRIHPNPNQPRQRFDQQGLEDLARSLKQDGFLQPVILRQGHGGDDYELVAGERRWRAAQLAGLLRIPALVREVADDRVLTLALIENLQREELDPIEEAVAFQTLIDDLGLTQQDVALRVGKQRTTVTNALRLLNLPAPVQEMVQLGQLTPGHAKALASVTDTRAQIELARRIADQGLTVRSVEKLVSRRGRTGEIRAASSSAPRDPNEVAAEQSLQRALGTKVRIVRAKKGGRVELHFFSDEELQRLYQILTGAAPS